MKLRKITTCTRNLTWETTLPRPVDDDLCRKMEQEGATLTKPLPRLLQVAWKELLVVIVGTRAQIRLSYMTPDEMRRFAAERVFVWLAKVIRAEAPPPG